MHARNIFYGILVSIFLHKLISKSNPYPLSHEKFTILREISGIRNEANV